MIRTLWDDKCTIIVREKAQNPVNKLMEFTEITKYTDEPCKLSFSKLAPTGNGDFASASQSIKLFIGGEIDIPPGSKITVTHKGKASDYNQSGVPGVYSNHQEISLELFKGWA